MQKEQLEISLTGYAYQFAQYIQAEVVPSYSAMTIGAAGVKQYENLPSASLLGGEMHLTLQLSDGWSLVGVGQYSLGQDDEGNSLPLIPPLQLQGALRYTSEKTSVQVEGNWNAAQHRFSSDFGEDMTPAFWIANIR